MVISWDPSMSFSLPPSTTPHQQRSSTWDAVLERWCWGVVLGGSEKDIEESPFAMKNT